MGDVEDGYDTATRQIMEMAAFGATSNNEQIVMD
jgi:hypothetical protein